MNRVKPITKILKKLIMDTLPSLIEPNGNQCQKRKSLLNNFYLKTKHLNLIIIAT